ncbi:hypothetical protein [Eleftheria terrae]|uniref:hypothetical protein n=1 Tax=Eleftheria terrae TaxID=1597781 RepID=UPI00263A6675|nr:hypothetical protein [Eleftheria terrae]WKB55606.1 hypothetical protein N7L95_26395 [Eleftheria terrae]
MAATRALAHEHRVAVVAVRHGLNLAACWCARLLQLAVGLTAAGDPPDGVMAPAAPERACGVSAAVLPHPDRPGVPLVLLAGRAASSLHCVGRPLA